MFNTYSLVPLGFCAWGPFTTIIIELYHGRPLWSFIQEINVIWVAFKKYHSGCFVNNRIYCGKNGKPEINYLIPTNQHELRECRMIAWKPQSHTWPLVIAYSTLGPGWYWRQKIGLPAFINTFSTYVYEKAVNVVTSAFVTSSSITITFSLLPSHYLT